MTSLNRTPTPTVKCYGLNKMHLKANKLSMFNGESWEMTLFIPFINVTSEKRLYSFYWHSLYLWSPRSNSYSGHIQVANISNALITHLDSAPLDVIDTFGKPRGGGVHTSPFRRVDLSDVGSRDVLRDVHVLREICQKCLLLPLHVVVCCAWCGLLCMAWTSVFVLLCRLWFVVLCVLCC